MVKSVGNEGEKIYSRADYHKVARKLRALSDSAVNRDTFRATNQSKTK